MRRALALLSTSSLALGSIGCGLTADFSHLQGGDAGLADCDAGCGVDATSTLGNDAGEDSAPPTGTCPTGVTSCPIQVTLDKFDTSYDGYITYQNTGTGDEIDPTLAFTVPSGVTLYTVGCAGPVGFQDQSVPSGITALSCSQSGTTISYAFTGTMPAGSQIAIYYTTNLPSEAAALCVTVTATSCP